MNLGMDMGKNMESWVEVDPNSDFSIYNLPYGIFKTKSSEFRPGVRIGNFIIDLSQLAELGYFDSLPTTDLSVFYESVLNPFIAQGRDHWTATRKRLIELFRKENEDLKKNKDHQKAILVKVEDAEMGMPVEVPDYTDFYSSIEHATNVGIMFRGKENALMPNWKHLPVGYHGRASSIVVSGTPIHRPKGQTKADDADIPSFGPSKLFDFELEMAFITGVNTDLGESIPVEKAEDYIFGMVLFNDWSARDIQKWEYVPLGPFLGKNFGSSVSPWIVTMDALAPFRVEGPKQDPEPLDYLKEKGNSNVDIRLQASIITSKGAEKVISNTNFKYMYWSMRQQLAHHTVNGCNIRVGDIYASGTISGPTEDSYGSLLELTWRGSKPISMPDGTERKFLQDGDTLVMKGYCQKDDIRVGFGEVSGKVLPAK
ncbi:MAG: fumarylacetoacetase [Cytophagales bacterium]